jgi:outer membrane protein assembly factor BamB
MAYATHRQGLYAIDLKEGEIRWQSSRVNGNHLAVVGNSLFATTSTRWIKTGLVQLDLETKRLERKLRLEEDAPFSVRDGVLYVYRKLDEFAAIDLATGKTFWTCRLCGRLGDAFLPRFFEDLVVFGRDDEDFVVAEIATGKVIWRRLSEGERYFHRFLGLFGDVAVSHDGNVVTGCSVQSGEVRWNLETDFIMREAASTDRLAISNSDALFLIDPSSGRTALRYDYVQWDERRADGTLVPRPPIAWIEDTLVFEDLATMAYDEEGRRRWRTRRLKDSKALWTDGETLVMRDDRRLFGYEMGRDVPPPADPETRAEWVRAQIGRADFLDRFELETLNRLGDEAFESILDALYPWGASKAPYRDSNRVDTLQGFLRNHMTPERTAVIVQALRRLDAKHPEGGWLFRLLRLGDPQVAGPFLVEYLNAAPRSEWEHDPRADTALNVLCHCAYDPGIDLLIDVLNDDAYEPPLTAWIPHYLANAGPRGVEAVIAHRRRFRPRPGQWRGTTRTAETDLERALEAAFAAFGFAGERSPLVVSFPRGVEPFAMAGGRGGLFTVEPSPAVGDSHRALYLGLGKGQAVLDNYPNGTVLAIDLVRGSEGTSGGGCQIEVKKFGTEWAPISIGGVWIS